MSALRRFGTVLLLALPALSGPGCGEDVYQVIDRTESPDDPAVIPRVIYTYPPANSVGPYPDIYVTPCGYSCSAEKRLQLRFNKFMDVAAVRRSISLSSARGDVRIDPDLVVPVGGDVFIVTPVDSGGSRHGPPILAIGETYTLGVDTTALDIHGNRLAAPYSMTFVPEPYFRVRGAYPDPGETEVSGYTRPRVHFNSRVDAGILGHLHLSPADPGAWSVSDDGLTVDFSGGNRSYGTTYSVSVDAAAADGEGRTIGAPYEFSFSTISFDVSYSVPENTATGVSLTDPLRIYTTVPLDLASVGPAWKISPAVPGTLSAWAPPIQFSPSAGFRGSTSYIVTVDTTLRANNGQPLAQPFSFSFVTRPFSVDSTRPAAGDSGHPTSAWVRVFCNAPLDVTTVPGAVTISPATLLTFSATEPTAMFMLHPLGLFQTKTAYTVTIDTTLRSKAGSPMEEPYVFSFTTQ